MKKENIVILVHGIRTHANWFELVKNELSKSNNYHVYRLGYGYYDVVRFLLPTLFSRGPIEKIRRDINHILSNADNNSTVTIICHSFGTHVISQILKENPTIQIDKLVLCGSIVKNNFKWDSLPNFPKSGVINDCGDSDIWPILARNCTFGYGNSGRYGFKNPQVHDRYHKNVKHSDFFKRDFIKKFWLSFIQQNKIIDSNYYSKTTFSNSITSIFSVIPINWFLLITLIFLFLSSLGIVNSKDLIETIKNPSSLYRPPTIELQKSIQNWVDIAKEARKSGIISPARPFPPNVSTSRSIFEKSWEEASKIEKDVIDPRLAYEALSLTAKTYRIQENQNDLKPSAQKWVDKSIEYFESINNKKYLVESLLDKAAVFLEISQIEHTEPDAWREIAAKGDSILARAYSLSDSDQRSDTLRIWSRFFYNLSRPRSGNLTKDWDNSYILTAVEKMEQAYSLDSSNMKNATQLARTTQKAAANPPQNTDASWTEKLESTHGKLLKTWEENNADLKTATQRIPPLNIIAVLTLDLTHRKWEAILSKNVSDIVLMNGAKELVEQLDNTGINSQQESITLLPNTEWHEDYDFDMYYDLARLQSVKCRIMQYVSLPNYESQCAEVTKTLNKSKLKATAIQLISARQAMQTDPTLSSMPEPYKTQMNKLLDSPEL